MNLLFEKDLLSTRHDGERVLACPVCGECRVRVSGVGSDALELACKRGHVSRYGFRFHEGETLFKLDVAAKADEAPCGARCRVSGDLADSSVALPRDASEGQRGRLNRPAKMAGDHRDCEEASSAEGLKNKGRSGMRDSAFRWR